MKQYRVLTFASATSSLHCEELVAAMNGLASEGYVLLSGTYKMFPLPVNIDQHLQAPQFIFTCVMEKTIKNSKELK